MCVYTDYTASPDTYFLELESCRIVFQELHSALMVNCWL